MLRPPARVIAEGIWVAWLDDLRLRLSRGHDRSNHHLQFDPWWQTESRCIRTCPRDEGEERLRLEARAKRHRSRLWSEEVDASGCRARILWEGARREKIVTWSWVNARASFECLSNRAFAKPSLILQNQVCSNQSRGITEYSLELACSGSS